MRAFGAMPDFLECFAAQKKRVGHGHFFGHFSKTVAMATKLDKFGKNRSKKRFLGHAGRAFFGLSRKVFKVGHFFGHF